MYGAYILTDAGFPFITPASSPLAMISKKTATMVSNGHSEITQNFEAGNPIIPFVVATAGAKFYYTISSNTCVVSADKPEQSGATYTVYFFTIFTQPLPKWGMAIWDANGRCILTNETRVLTDVTPIGINGDDSNSGYNINTTLTGKWAVIPSQTGLGTGVITDGGTRPWSSEFSLKAVFNGSSTLIGQNATDSASGNIQNLTYHNMRNRAFIINAAKYD
ncbi:hypothetical protein ACTEV4_000636 [Cronobacter turicensis]